MKDRQDAHAFSATGTRPENREKNDAEENRHENFEPDRTDQEHRQPEGAANKTVSDPSTGDWVLSWVFDSRFAHLGA